MTVIGILCIVMGAIDTVLVAIDQATGNITAVTYFLLAAAPIVVGAGVLNLAQN